MKCAGKIARLPYHTREELNRRLLDNEPGGTGKEEGRVKNDELGIRDQSRAVAPGRTTISSDLVMSALADVAASGRNAEPMGKPLPGMPNSLLSKALKAAREKARPGQPTLTVLPEWDELDLVAQPAISLCKK